MKRKNFPDRKKRRQETVRKSQKARKKRSAEDQLALLDAKFGEGKGAMRERARLEEEIVLR